MSSSLTIAIVGAGAIGGYYGARLAQHGHEVHFLLRSDYEQVNRVGWKIQSVNGDFNLAPSQFHGHEKVEQFPSVDLVVVTLKSTSADLYESLIGPLLGPETAILTLQNGLGNEKDFASRFGASHVIGGLAWICSTRIAPGTINHTFGGRIQLADFVARSDGRAQRIATAFNQSQVEAEVLGDIRTGKWQKLAWNVAFSGLGALLGLSTDRLLGSESGVQYVSALMAEVVAIAAAQKIPITGDFIHKAIPFTWGMGTYRTSMQIDREQGRPMELGPILAEPLRLALEMNVQTPRLRAIYELLSLLNSDISAAAPLHAPLTRR